MSDSSGHKIFTSTDCISEQTMFDYIDNKLSAKERHIVEKHMLDCGFCSDALEGLEMVKDRDRIEMINQKVNERIAQVIKEKKIISINYRFITAVAASLLLVVGSIFLFKEFSSPDMEEKSIADLKEPPPAPLPITINETKSDSINFATPLTKNKEVQFEIKKNAAPLAFNEEPKPNTPITLNDAVTATAEGNGNTIASNETMDKNNQAAATDKNVELDNMKKADKDEDIIVPLAAPAMSQKSDEFKTRESAKKSRSASDKKAKEEQYDAPKNSAASRIAVNSDSIYTIADEMPEYPGGNAMMLNFIHQNFRSPKISPENGLPNTKIYLQFIVDKNGDIKNAKILKGIDSEYDKEALRVVNMMPRWKPGKQNGQAVSVKYNLPIQLEIK